MTQESFGGSWTVTKLEMLEKYLKAYVTIFKGNPRAQFLTTVYIDAFAGTGTISGPQKTEIRPSLFVAEAEDVDTEAFLRGSARIALDLDPSFDKYIFIEKNKPKLDELSRLIDDKYSHLRSKIEIVHQDAVKFLLGWCSEMDVRSQRAVLFLDPFGMEVEWSLVEAIAKTEVIDMWMLFPLSGVSRHLTKGEPPPEEWASRITRSLGTDHWKVKWYPPQRTQTLFGEEEQQIKDIDFSGISDFVVD